MVETVSSNLSIFYFILLPEIADFDSDDDIEIWTTAIGLGLTPLILCQCFKSLGKTPQKYIKFMIYLTEEL